MARTMPLDPQPTFRAVILKRFPGLHNMDLKTYTMPDGSTIDYHAADVYGPYAAQATAKSQLNTEVRHLTEWGTYFNGSRITPDMDSFIEATEAVWTRV